jgi:NAD+ kinase
MRVFLTGSSRKPESGGIFRRLESRLPAVCELAGAGLDAGREAILGAAPGLVVVVGGDGTLIGAARLLAGSGVPLAGVNAGKLGFLAEFSEDELLAEISSGAELAVSERMMLSVSAAGFAGAVAVNEVAVRDDHRLLRVSVDLDGVHLTDVPGDGVLLCTPTGSTAYNMAAGGPLVQPGVPAMVLTAVCPHGFGFRPLVLEAGRVVTIRPAAACGLSIDGQPPVPIQAGGEVSVSRHPSPFVLVHSRLRPPWHAMQAKLGWGR